MAKKAQKVKKNKRSELLIVNLNAAGIDVASTEYQVCVPEDRDENYNRKFDSFTCDLREIVKWLKKCKIETVAMEATGIYWIQLYLILQAAGFDVVVCNAKHIKNLGEKKTDYVDAGWIQLLHTYGLLNDSFQPENRIREIKDLNRYRDKLVERCSQSVLRMQKALETMNIKIHKVLSDIKGKSGQAILKAIINGERNPEKLYSIISSRVKASKEDILKSLDGNWVESQVFILNQNFDVYIFTKGQIKELDKKIEELLDAYIPLLQLEKQDIGKGEFIRSKKKIDANNAPNFDMEKYSFEILGVNLTRIPGISSLSTLKIVSELGPNFTEKFPTPDKFCSWVNVAPNNKKSGGKLLSSKIPKRYNYVGQTLRVAASTLKSHKGYLGEVFRTKKGKLGHNQAIVAVAHKLARIIYKMVKDKVDYNEQIEQNKNKEIMIRKIAYYERKLAKTKKEVFAMAC